MSFVRSNVVRRAAPVRVQPSQQSDPTSTPSATASHLASPTPSTTAALSAPSRSPPPPSHAATSALSSLPPSLLPSSTPPTAPASLPLPGTRSWLHSLTFVPSGLPDLDSLLSGGLYLHSLLTLGEDESGQWDAFTRLYAAEAVEWQQPVLTVSTRSTEAEREWMYHLPRAVRHRSDHRAGQPQQPSNDSLRIAWRYGAYKDRPQDAQSNMRASSAVTATAQRPHSLSHTFNLRLRSNHAADQLAALHSHVQVVNGGDGVSEAWTDLYERLCSELDRLCGTGDSGNGSTGRVVRLIIRSAADIDWCVADTAGESHRHFLLFLHRLRGLLHRYPAICLLTYPPALFSAATLATLHHFATLSLALHTLQPTSPYRQYDCLLHIHPQPPIHSLVSEAAGASGGGGEWLVECREVVRLDKVSLPPEESRNEDGQGQAQQTVGGGRERGKVEVESDMAATGGNGAGGGAGGRMDVGEKAAHRHAHGLGCGSGGSEW